jgi:hypothetical protein
MHACVSSREGPAQHERTTYRATFEGGFAVITVKRLRELPILDKKNFRGTVAALSHDNLVPLCSYL